MTTRTCALLASLAVTPATTANAESAISADGLRCEYRVEPDGIDVAAPRLGWILTSAARGQVQTAYQVLVAGERLRLETDEGDLWDSGKVMTSQTAQVAYAGKPLQAHQECWWKVRVWDRDGQASSWSKVASWSMGLAAGKPWQARWIGWKPAPSTAPATTQPAKPAVTQQPLPILRREFEITKPITQARLYVCGLGFNEVRLNGRKVGDHVLDPGWTHYRKTCLYSTYDVTANIALGRNALGIMLGNGMYNVVGGRYVKFTGSFGPPKLILQLHIEYADGTTTEIGTDESWRVAASPITFSCIYGGEDYDARLEQSGWDRPGFDDEAWQPAAVVDGPGGRLRSQSAPPIRIMKTFKPVKVTEPGPGVCIYDLGQNFSGWPQIKVRGPAGTQLRLIPAELLNPKGFADQSGSGGPCFFVYTLKGDGEETWHPQFTYYGFRYVQVEGAARDAAQAAGRPVLLELEGHFVHSSAPVVGEFSCSNPLFNNIHDIILAAIRSNLQSVNTDCPHREKLGWLEVPHLLGPAIMFNFDVATLYVKISDDTAEAQLDNGLVPDIAPEYTVFSKGFRDSPEWGSAAVIVPWLTWQRYGERRALESRYDCMKRYVDYLGTTAKDLIVSHGLGDWCDFGPAPYGPSQHTPIPLTATAMYYCDAAIVAETARLLGNTADAEKYAQLAGDIRAAFNHQFFHPDTGQYATGSQAANAIPLVLGLAEHERVADILENLVKDVRVHDNHLTAGDIGHRFLVQALRQGGRSDVLFDMTNQRNVPSYGAQIEQGATSLTEVWDPKRGFSQNHCMLGHIEEWFYNGLAGIDQDPGEVGFANIVIKPQVVGDITWVKAHYDSIRGRITSEWKRENDTLVMDVTIPPNTTATVYVPAGKSQTVTVNQGATPRIAPLRREKSAAVFKIGSGEYQFAARP
ncbi:MAG TPA: glycoside hydrolase family 78 protein [Phycisphaerae bacterium]|nr:glycoside hydrolase family 78 protein [Phycisphaerae bacterium]HRY68153.1 glycoside hydrolase family 78 protein [Phycisphaerae bacterium]HSA27049.1 glycoside hydrolase family 78 protein [Phycisphaerae bacterium]